MSAYCPEGVGTCEDAVVGPCVVGHPCALHPEKCHAERANNDGSYTECTLDSSHAEEIPAVPHSFELMESAGD